MDEFFVNVTGVSVAACLGIGLIALVRRGRPSGRTWSDIYDLRAHWRALLILCFVGCVVGIVGQLVT